MWVFSPTMPYTTWTPACFQLVGPFEVDLLVEAGLELDERDHLLAGLGRADERGDDAALLAAGAVQRLLDREHVRIACRLVDELGDARRERVVGVVHEHVARLQQRGTGRRAGRCG